MTTSAAWPNIPDETPIDVSALTLKLRALGIQTRKDLSKFEAQNITKAVFKYLSARPSSWMAPFDFSWVLKLHREMFDEVWQWAGQIRQIELNIGRPIIHIQADLYALLEDLHSWTSFKMPLLEQAVRLHHRAVAIHPFPNGKGRWARLLSNVWLKVHRQPLIEWPESTVGDESIIRAEYIAALKLADRGDYGPLIELHTRYVGQV